MRSMTFYDTLGCLGKNIKIWLFLSLNFENPNHGSFESRFNIIRCVAFNGKFGLRGKSIQIWLFLADLTCVYIAEI